MIGYLKGTLLQKFGNTILVNVNGVGYEVWITTKMLDKLVNVNVGGSIELFCQLIVREDAHTLYGFTDELEKTLFKLLIKINGVGPKLAITILSWLSPKQLIATVQNNNIDALIEVPGIGKRSAERLMVELKSSFTKIIHEIELSPVHLCDCDDNLSGQKIALEVYNALIALGFKSSEVKNVLVSMDLAGKNSQDIIREALQLLTRGI